MFMRPRLQPTLAIAALLAGCAASPRMPIDTPEAFDSAATYTRTYAAMQEQTCEAARRTLLSQGYVISLATAEQVRGRKSFQPEPETHVEVEFNVVCAKDGHSGRRTIAFVNAVQDRFALRKSNNSASLGVGAFGSLSLPFTGSDESLVKVASATITRAPFYDRFFQLVERYLAGDPGQHIGAVSEALDKELPPIGAPVPGAPRAAAAAAASASASASSPKSAASAASSK